MAKKITYVEVDLTVDGVVGEDGEDLLREDGPHTVTEEFAQALYHHNRAQPFDPDRAAKAEAAAKARAAKAAQRRVQNGDPA